MSYFEILVVGGGVAGATFALLAQREGYRVAVVEKRGELLRGASGAAGAFLFPKVGFDTPYTRFINQGIVEGLKFWKGEGVEMDQSGVLILPRDQRDFNKFEKYKPHLQLKWEEREFVTPTGEVEKGFFFPEGGVVEVGSVRKRLKEEVEVIPVEMEKLERVKGGWNINGRLRSKLVVLAMGAEGNRWLPPYLQINPIWGQRISLKTEFTPPHNYHKRVSLSTNRDGLVKIGATHRRNCPQCKENLEETAELLNKAAEIVKIEGEVVEVKGGFRAGTRDFFPVVGPILDWEETLRLNPKIVKGEPLRTPVSYPDLYIINGMGGRGFSNAVLTARLLLDHISKGTSILDRLHPARLLIKYARRLERTG